MNDASGLKAAALLLVVAAAGWYLASRAAAEALAAAAPSPGRRAIGMSIPTAVLALLAIVLGRAEVAVGIIFASSVAGLSLVLGVMTISANPLFVSRPRRVWGFVMPAAMVALLLGLRAGIGWMQAAVLAVEGLVILLLWNDPAAVPSGVAATAIPAAPIDQPPAPILRTLVFLTAIVAAAVGSFAALRAVEQITTEYYMLNRGLVTVLLLAPAMVLPMIGTGSQAAHLGDFDNAVTTQVGIILINLCAILPLAASLWLTRPMWSAALIDPPQAAIAAATTHPATTSAADRSTTIMATTSTAPATAPDEIEPAAAAGEILLPYPMGVWRVDTVLLVALGMLLLPVSLGRWGISFVEGYFLLLVYALYLALSAYVAR
jgi:Ca2+/Na+ antiporter